jgi:hypothetical protein
MSMVNNKYYQPTIEEFHVGFECEAKVLIEENKCEWRPFIIKQPNYEWMNVHTDGEYKTYTVPECVRVKYLDREDIESCGWKYSDEVTYYYTTDISCIRLSLEGKNNYSIYYLDNTNTNCIFQGTIKNKSQLKKLMQQLNII